MKMKWDKYLSVAIFQASIALVWLLLIPKEASSALLLGLSAQRMILLLPPLAVLMIASGAKIALRFNLQLAEKIFNKLDDIFQRSYSRLIFQQLFAFLFLVFIYSIPGFHFNPELILRLLPDLLLAILLAVELYAVMSNSGKSLKNTSRFSINPSAITIILFISLSLAVFLAVFGTRITETASYYSGLGSPILADQLLLILIVVIAVSSVYHFPKPPAWQKLLKIGLGLFLLFAAYIFWTNTSVPIDYFWRPSNLSEQPFFPNSDARTYDLNAQSMLLGNGLSGGQPLPRPLYSFILGIIHLFAGQNYLAVLNWQTLLLAAFPVMAFWSVKKTINIEAGLMIGLLIIVREYNQIKLSWLYTLYNVRSLLSEGITSIFLLVFVLVSMAWLARKESTSWALLCGSVLGLLACIRTQALALAPVIILFAWLFPGDKRKAFSPILYFCGGILLIVLAWMGRNLLYSGQFTFEDPAYAQFTLAKSFGSISLYLERTVLHFSNSLASSLYQLPFSFELRLPLETYASQYQSGAAFVVIDNGQISLQRFMTLLFHTSLVSLGLRHVVKKNGWIGLIPAGVYLGYNLSAAGVGFSGWRFMQPVDWVILCYWGAGVAWISDQVFSLPNDSPADHVAWWMDLGMPSKKMAITVTLFMAGLMPIGERLFAKDLPLYQVTDPKQQVFSLANHLMPNASLKALQSFMDDPLTSIIVGKILYPLRARNEREFLPFAYYYAFSYKEPLLLFTLLDEKATNAFIKADEVHSVPKHYSDVVAIGCLQDGSLKAYIVLSLGVSPDLLIADEPIPETCPK